MKIFKSKNFKALIYSIFLSLPFLTIVGRTIYTIANKNAKDSYYGETINETELTLITSNNLPSINDKIHFKGVSGEEVINNTNKNIYFTNPHNIYVQPYVETIITNIQNSSYFQCTYYGTTNYIVFYNSENVQSQVVGLTQYVFEFDFTLVDYQLNNITWENGFNGYMYKYEYNKYSYLDNAFEYSIYKFTDDNHFGKLNFFQWFSDLFLNNNQTNNLYIHFINWYMNYILYVSLAYLLFAVLMWFVNFFRSLVEKNMDLGL